MNSSNFSQLCRRDYPNGRIANLSNFREGLSVLKCSFSTDGLEDSRPRLLDAIDIREDDCVEQTVDFVIY